MAIDLNTKESFRMKDYDAAILAMFGSFEKYRTSPQLLEVCKRITYLNDAKVKLQKRLDKELDAIKWWDCWNKFKAFLAVKFAYPTLFKELDEHIDRYERLRPLPARMLINSANEKFAKTWRIWGTTMLAAGVEEYKND